MEEINEWLESGQDYAQGVALYAQHGRSAVVRNVLAFGETEFTRAKLVQELTKMLGISPNAGSSGIVDKAIVAKPTMVGKAPVVDPQRRDWFAERNHLHAQLGLVATDAERRTMALRILDLGDLISQSYQAGATPSPEERGAGGGATPGLAALADAGEIRRLLANLRPQRTKLKKRPDRATDLLQVEAAIHLLEEKLKL